ncbi:hypothetical protein SG1895 [Sodalis glossinidius str. 'morsitans']|uniref:Uncharacterized protein n=1 Tax=Sodalis glossinidius (strain morsitans) TaxID=343509 RepID=Q2NRQ5_SODGM|nr:hypothetical protein SG1895 [Sodalis glossinidius str. 'morsitans']
MSIQILRAHIRRHLRQGALQLAPRPIVIGVVAQHQLFILPQQLTIKRIQRSVPLLRMKFRRLQAKNNAADVRQHRQGGANNRLIKMLQKPLSLGGGVHQAQLGILMGQLTVIGERLPLQPQCEPPLPTESPDTLEIVQRAFALVIQIAAIRALVIGQRGRQHILLMNDKPGKAVTLKCFQQRQRMRPVPDERRVHLQQTLRHAVLPLISAASRTANIELSR